MSRLDDLVLRARELRVRDDVARTQVTELARWARPLAEPRRSPLPWFAGGFALAAAAAIALWILSTRGDVVDGEAVTEAVGVGDRVAIVADPHTRYRVIASDTVRTEILVERGTITARLWPGARPHRLALRGAGVEAIATGTVFALAVDERGASVHVHEGTVEIVHGKERAQLRAGAAWPSSIAYRGRAVGDDLLALPAPPEIQSNDVAPDSPIASDAAIEAIPDAGSAASLPTRTAQPALPSRAANDAGVTISLKERYRRARLLRAQGDFDAAVTECLSIADAKDPVWSPIALLEAARIEQSALASPERAVLLTQRFEREWSTHQLAPEARELHCRALRPLGRADECNRGR